MRQVLCINATNWRYPKSYHVFPVEGEVYTVVEECEGDSYVLAELRNNKNGSIAAFLKRRFIPLSSIDETEMERNYNIETQKA